MALTLLSFVLVLSLLVFAHELGHFVLAKRAGIRVQEFGFGYPPRLVGIKVGETIYSLNLLPLGGFVRMQGENDQPGDPHSFATKTKWQRAAVLIAGSAMNLVLAPLLFTTALIVGEQTPCASCDRVQIYGVLPNSPAAAAGLREGDVFVRIEAREIRTPQDVRLVVQQRLGQPIPIVVAREGRQQPPVTVVPRTNPPEGQGAIGIRLGPEIVTVRHPVAQAVPLGLQRTGQTLRLFWRGIQAIASREVPAQVAGPVGIAEMTGEAARAGLANLLQFTAFLSIQLAIFNMLPIPGLDGARLAFVAIEGARRGRRFNPQVEGLIHFVGLMLLISLMVVVTYQDILRASVR